jgi:hypothetical protein
MLEKFAPIITDVTQKILPDALDAIESHRP